MKRWQAIILFTIGAGVYGFTPIFAKLSFAAGYSLAELNVTQMIIASLTLWIIALAKNRTIQITKKQVIRLLLAGTLTGLTSVFYYGSMLYVPASIAIILLFQFVWVGVLYEWLFKKIVPTWTTYISIALTLLGVVFAANMIGGDFSTLPVIGIVLGICSAFTYAGFIYVSGNVATEVESQLRTAIMMTGSFILIMIVFPPTFLFTEAAFSSIWLYGAGTAFFGAILPPMLILISAPYLSTALASILGSIELPVAVVLASIILSETVTLFQWIGILLILLAISFGELVDYTKQMLTRKKSRKLT